MPEKLTPVDRARRALIRLGYDEDELKVSFKTDEELLAFYAELQASSKAVKQGKLTEPEDEDEDEPLDTFKLRKTEEEALKRQQTIEQEADKREKQTEEKQVFETTTVPPKNLEPGEKPPTYDDFLKSLEDGMSSDDSTVPNN